MHRFTHEVIREELPLYRNGPVTGALIDVKADLTVAYDEDGETYEIDAIRVRAYGGSGDYATVHKASDLGELILTALEHPDENLASEVAEAAADNYDRRHDDYADWARDQQAA